MTTHIQIPEEIRIGGYKYSVIIEKEAFDVDGVTADGACHRGLHVIRLNSGLCRDAMEQTFLHELVHVMVDFMGIKFKKNDESYTDNLAQALYSIIVQNPFLFEYNDTEAN